MDDLDISYGLNFTIIIDVAVRIDEKDNAQSSKNPLVSTDNLHNSGYYFQINS